jgi:hypothetical protein
MNASQYLCPGVRKTAPVFVVLGISLLLQIFSPLAIAEQGPDFGEKPATQAPVSVQTYQPVQPLQSQQELDWLRDSPQKLGNAVFVNEPLKVGEVVKIRQHVTLGNEVSVGGGFLLGSHWQDGIEFQVSDANAPNYVSIEVETRVSNVEFEVSMVGRKGIFGGLTIDKEQPYFSILAGQMEPGQSLRW